MSGAPLWYTGVVAAAGPLLHAPRTGACSKPRAEKEGLKQQERVLQENKGFIGIQVERCLKGAANGHVPGPGSGSAVLAFQH